MAKSLLPALPGGRITNRAGRDRPRFIRPVERQRMRPWLEEHLDKNDIPGLLWVDKKERIFKIAWKHAANQCFNLQKDTNLFERWAIHTGRHYDSDHKRWKANFRCALNSLPDVKENKEQGVKKGNNAFKVYRFLDEKETRGLKETKVRKKPTFRTETALTVHDDDDEYIPKGLVSLKERPDPNAPSIPNLEQLYPTSGVEMLIQAGAKQKVEALTDTADDTNLQEILAAATASLAAGSDPATLENISINQLKRLGEVSRMKLDVRQGVKKNSPGYMYVFLCRWCEKVFSRKIELFQHFLVTHQDRLMAGEEYGEQTLEETNSDTKHQKLLEEIEDLEQKVLGFSEKSYQSSEAGSEEYLDDQIAANEVIGDESGTEEKALDLTVQNKSPKASTRQDVALDLSMSTGKKAKHSKQGQGKQIVKRRRSSQESDLNYSVKFGNYGIVGTPRTKRQMSLHTRKKEEEQERLAKKLTTTDGQDASRQHSIEDIVHAEMLLSLKTGNEDGNENSSGSGSSKKDTKSKGKKGKMAAKKTSKGDKSKMDDKSMIHGSTVKLSTDIDVAEEVVEDTDDDESSKPSSVKAYLYKCGLCFHKFTSSARLSDHLESHDGTFLQVCKTCGHESLSKEEMIQHFDSAHSYLTYKCNFCNKMCKSVKKLKNHMWSHISKCEICGEKFYNVELLDVHLKEQHGIDPDSIKKEEEYDDKTDDSETDDADEEDMNGDKDSNASTEKAEDSDHGDGDDHGPDGGGNGGTNSADGANGDDAPGADGPGASKSDNDNGINDNKDQGANGPDTPSDSNCDKDNGMNDNNDQDKNGANGGDIHCDSNSDNNNGINDSGNKEQDKQDPENKDSNKDEENMDIDPYSFLNRAETMKTPMEIKKEETVNSDESLQNKDTNKSTDVVVHSQPCPSGLEKVSNVHKTECKLLMDSGEADLMSAQTDNVYTVKKVVNVMNPFDGMEKDSKMVRISVEISKETNKPTYSAEYQLSQIKEAIRRAGLLKKTMRTSGVGECFICFQDIPMIDLENHIRGHSVVELSKVKAALDVLGIKINALERSLYMCNLCNVGLESAQALSLHVSKHLTHGNPPTAKTVPVARKRKQSSPKDSPKAKNAKLKPPKNKDNKDIYVSTPTNAKGENVKLSKKETSSSCSVLAAYLNAGPLYQSSALTKALQQHLQAKIKTEASTEQSPNSSEANFASNTEGFGTNTDSIQENAGKSLAESLLQGGKSSSKASLQTLKVDKGHSVDAKGDNASNLPEPSATNDDSDQDTDRTELIDMPGQKTDEDREFRILLKKRKSTKTSVPVSKPWETTSAALSDVKVVQATVSTETNQSPMSLAPSVVNVLPGNMFTKEIIGANPKPPLFLQSAKNVITDPTNPVTSAHVTEPNAIKTGFNQTSPHPIFLISNKNLVKNLNMKHYEMFGASDGTNVPKFVRLLKRENTGVLSVDPKSSQPIKADTFTSITSPIVQGSDMNISSPLNVLLTSSSDSVYVPPKFLQGSSSITSTLPASIAHGQNLPVAMSPATVRFISPKQLHSAQQQMTIGKRSMSFDAIRNQNNTITFLKQKLSSVAVTSTSTALSSPLIATKDIVAANVPSMENQVVNTNIADQIGKQTDSTVDSIMRKTPTIKQVLSAPSPILTSTSHNISNMIRPTQAPISTTPSVTNSGQIKNTSHVVASANQVGPQVHISMTSPSVINTALLSPSMINAPQMVISSTQPSSINVAQYTALLNQLPGQVISTSQPTMITTGKCNDPTSGQLKNTMPSTNIAQQATLMKQPAAMLNHTDHTTGQLINALPSTNIAQLPTMKQPTALLNVKLSQLSQPQSVSPLTIPIMNTAVTGQTPTMISAGKSTEQTTGQVTNTLPQTNVVQLSTILKQPAGMLNHTGRTTGQITNTLPSTNIAQQATFLKQPAATLNVKLPQMSQPQSVSPLTIPIMNSAVTGQPPYVGVSSAPTIVSTEFLKPTFNLVLTQSSTTLPVTSPSIASSIYSQIHGHKIPILKTMGPVMPHETKPKKIGMEGSASIISQTPNPLQNRLALVCTFCKEEIHSLEMITKHVCKSLQATTKTAVVNESKNSEVDTGILSGTLVNQSFESSVNDAVKIDTMLVNSEHSAKPETSENLRTVDSKDQEKANIADFHRKTHNCSLNQAAVTSFSKKSDDKGIDLNEEVEVIRPVYKNTEINTGSEISKSRDGEAGLKCDDCGLGGFRSTFLLKQHRVIRHLHPVARTSPSYYQHVVENIKRSKTFECGVCRHKVESKSSYQQHLRVHIKSLRGNYLCSHQDCSLKFKTRLSCLNHIKVCKNGKSKPVRTIEAQNLVNPFPNTTCF